MPTTAPVDTWSAVIPLTGPSRYSATPAPGGSILLQWSTDNVNGLAGALTLANRNQLATLLR